jgi:DNA-binding transcriptional LysR family regulator
MSGVDLLDLEILVQMKKTGSLSRSAEKVGLSQPSVSVRLRRLREHFRDPLFARTSHGMQPTPRGDGLITAAREALRLFEQAVSPDDAFDPATSNRTFRICMTDVAQVSTLPKLLTHLSTVAPNVSIEVLTPTGEIGRMLETREADTAIGVMLDQQSGMVRQSLFEEGFTCLVSAAHRRIGKSLTKEQFLTEAHVATNIESASAGLQLMNQAFSRQRIARRIALKVPSLLGLLQIVANTELLAVVPRHLGMALAEEGHVRALQVPFSMPVYRVMQYWHRRYHEDSGHRWLRGTVLKVLRTPKG